MKSAPTYKIVQLHGEKREIMRGTFEDCYKRFHELENEERGKCGIYPLNKN